MRFHRFSVCRLRRSAKVRETTRKEEERVFTLVMKLSGFSWK
jgi:hypothetical protein